MNKRLTYDEWVDMYAVPLDDETRLALRELHGIDADDEIEQARRKEYEFYLNGGFDKQGETK